MGLIRSLGPVGRVIAFWRIFRDRSVPWWSKLLFAVSSFAYLVMPADFVPDLLLGVGWLDDLLALPVFAYLFGKVVPGLTRWWQRRENYRYNR
ncbi:MAG: DUF1232 domain-containing protein [Planctomycetota bacterium]